MWDSRWVGEDICIPDTTSSAGEWGMSSFKKASKHTTNTKVL